MTNIKFHKAVVNYKGEYSTYLFKGYPSIKYINEMLRGNGFKVNSCVSIKEEQFNEEQGLEGIKVSDRTQD